jgi:hypothetical protein
MMVCFSNITGAQEIIPKWDDRSFLNKVLFSESVMGIGSFLISKNPRAWGTIEPWLFLAGAGALVAYNLKVDKTRTSESEIFKTNFAGMNAVGAILLTTRYLAGDSKNDRKFFFTYAPGPHGGRLFVMYRF